MRPLLPLLLLALVGAVPAAAAPVLYDLDGDLAYDAADVGDWDDDGVLETDDVQAAVDALTDTGTKTVNVMAGVYQPPDQAPAGPGLIQLKNNTTLACAPGAVLLGLPPPPAGPDVSIATVTNADHAHGNIGIDVTGCEITGGMPASYDSTGWQQVTRMGVYLNTVTNGQVLNNRVHDTLHSCLYAKNSREIFLNDNVVEDCGGYRDVSTRVGQPGIYLYSTTNGTTENVWVGGNIVRRTGSSALNLRRNDTSGLLRNIVLAGNWVEDTDVGTDCVTIRGADGITVRDTTCQRTGPIGTAPNAAGFYSSGTPHVDSVRGLTIQNVQMLQVHNGPGIYLRGFVEDATLLDVRVNGTEGFNACVQLKTPSLRTSIDGLTAEQCAGAGFLQETCAACGQPGEGLVLRNVEIHGADVVTPLDNAPEAGIRFSGIVRDLLLEDVSISGASGSGIDFGPNQLDGATIRNVSIDGVPSRFLGLRAVATLPACTPPQVQNWAVVSNAISPGSCFGGGGYQVICRCIDGAWRASGLPAGGRYGVRIRNGTSSDVSLEDVHAANFEASYGIRLEGAPSNVTILAPSATDDSPATPTGMLGAVDASADAVNLTVSGASCSGTNPAAPCVLSDVPYPDTVDPDHDGIGTQCDIQCSDGADNDGNGKIDYPTDPNCSSPFDPTERRVCGLGFEVGLVAPLLARLRRRRASAAR